MRDIIFTVLTSEGCGHCHHMRGNGDLGNGKQFTQYDFLKNHIDPLQNGKMTTILNIHYATMSGRREEIINISKVYMKGDRVFQEKYYNADNKVNVKVLSIGSDNKPKTVDNKSANVKESWMEFVQKKVPKNLENYTFFFPCFIVFEKEDWKRGGNILGLTNAGFTMRDTNGVYMLEKNGASLSKRNILPQKLVTEAISGVLDFKPHKDLVEPKKVEPKKVEPKKVEPKKVEPKETTVTSKCKFIIKNYDDE